MSLIVRDRDGKVLHEVGGANDLESCDLRRADFSGQVLEGINIADSDLREADCTGADMYWANAFMANCEGAIFRDAQLNGADLKETNFRGADLRGAYISFDNLNGPAEMQGADLTGALLDDAVLTGCEYNDSTVFPEDFDPIAHGMIWVDPERIFIRPGSFASAGIKPRFHIPDKNH
jgi:hypothetical protein